MDVNTYAIPNSLTIDILAVVFEKPLQQIFQTLRVGRKMVVFIGGHAVAISRRNAGHYKNFVDINATAAFVHDF